MNTTDAMNLRNLRAWLKSWGKWWAAQEAGMGYASVSITYRMMQTGQLGIISSSDKHLYSHGADSITPPDWVVSMDRMIEQLQPNQRQIIARRYIKLHLISGAQKRLLLTAEAALLSS